MEHSTSSIHRLHVIIEGRVQGVGFRYATQREAQGRGLCGWVRNLADGNVEAAFEGPIDDLERMLEWCQRGPGYASVTRVVSSWEQVAPAYSGFYIRG